MLRHGRAGVPMEVMGLMLGEFVDDYTVRVVDVFAMPQSGTGVSVEAVDPVFQTKMMEMLRQTGRCVAAIPYFWGIRILGRRRANSERTGLKSSSDGITRTLASDAGSPQSISTRSNRLSN